jgi:hypothetical protein
LRNFAQGLMVEALDASEAMGWIQVVFDSVTKTMMKKGERSVFDLYKKLIKKGGKHWFKHFLNKNLSELEIKIYEYSFI